MNSILIVTNNPLLRKRLKAILSGHEILPDARNAKEGITIYRSEQPPVVVVDLFLPETTGLDLIKTLRKSNEHLRVILISELRTRSFMERAFRFGADDVLTLPFSDETFVSCIQQRLEQED